MSIFNSTLLGLDIGSTSIKLIELKISKNKIKVVKYVNQSLASLNLNEKSHEIKLESYNTIIKNLISSNKIKTKKTAVSVFGDSVNVKFIKLPKVSQKKLNNDLILKEKIFTIYDDIDNIVFVPQILNTSLNDNSSIMDVMVVSCKKNLVEENFNICKNAGLNPVIITPDFFALEKIFSISNPEYSAETILFVNIRTIGTSISIFEKHTPKLIRCINFSGTDITEAIENGNKEFKGIGEKLKIKYGLYFNQSISQEMLSKETDEDIKTGREVYGYIYPVASRLILEIKRSLEYLKQQDSGSEIKINKILLSGATANLKYLPETITSELGIQTNIFQPLKNAKVKAASQTSDIMFPGFDVASGLSALKSKSNGFNKIINLVPKYLTNTNSNLVRKIVYATIILLIIAVSNLYYKQLNKLNIIERQYIKQKKFIQHEIKNILPVLEPVIIPKKVDTDSKLTFIKTLKVSGSFFDNNQKYVIVKSKNKTYIIKDGHIEDEYENKVSGIKASITKTKVVFVTDAKNVYEIILPE